MNIGKHLDQSIVTIQQTVLAPGKEIGLFSGNLPVEFAGCKYHHLFGFVLIRLRHMAQKLPKHKLVQISGLKSVKLARLNLTVIS